MKYLLSLFILSVFWGCSMDVDAVKVIQKYKEDPRRDGSIREAVIEEDILPQYHKEAKHQIAAIRFAKKCYIKTSDVTQANDCRKATVNKFGDEFDFNEFKVWDKEMKQKVMNFLNDNEVAVLCYDRAKKAKDLLHCPDPKDPDF